MKASTCTVVLRDRSWWVPSPLQTWEVEASWSVMPRLEGCSRFVKWWLLRLPDVVYRPVLRLLLGSWWPLYCPKSSLSRTSISERGTVLDLTSTMEFSAPQFRSSWIFRRVWNRKLAGHVLMCADHTLVTRHEPPQVINVDFHPGESFGTRTTLPYPSPYYVRTFWCLKIYLETYIF